MSSNTGTPNKSIRSRMGGVMRRTSSILSVGRPSTPSPASTPGHLPDESRRSSVSQSHEGRRSTTSLTQSAGPAVSLPPPEPQLPAITVDPQQLEVEQPAPAAPAPGPEVTEASTPMPAPPAITPDAPTPTPTPAPPANGSSLPKAVKRLLPIAQQYQMYPSPIAESPVREAAASTEERPAEDAPSAPAVEERPAEPAATVEAAPAAAAIEVQQPPTSTYVPPPLVLDSSNPGAYTDEPEEMMTPLARSAPAPVPQLVVAPVVVEEAAAPVPAPEVPAPQTIAEPILEAAPAPAAPSPALDDPGYFDLMHPAILQSIVSPASGSDTTVTVVGGEHAASAPLGLIVEPYTYEGPSQAGDESQPQTQSQVQEEATARLAGVSAPGVVGIQITRVPTPVARTEADDALARAEAEARVWEEAEAGRGWTVHDNEDPFADPPQEQSRREEENVGFPIPVIAVQQDHGLDVGGGPIPRSIRTGLSTEDISGRFQVSEPVTDERRPLLSAEAPSYGPANAGDASVPGLSFRDLGWIEYSLPARTVTYYVHPTLRVTTDVDLRKADALSRVGRALG